MEQLCAGVKQTVWEVSPGLEYTGQIVVEGVSFDYVVTLKAPPPANVALLPMFQEWACESCQLVVRRDGQIIQFTGDKRRLFAGLVMGAVLSFNIVTREQRTCRMDAELRESAVFDNRFIPVELLDWMRIQGRTA